MSSELAGLHILNTRPAAQAAGLSHALTAQGATVSELPLLAIEPLPLSDEARRRLFDLDRYDFVFFVSRNAARFGLEAVAGLWPQWPHALPALAVGPATADMLEQAGLSVLSPQAEDSSEGVLALPELATPAGKKVLVFRGEGGRELLIDSLRARGAQVDVIELYRRLLPPEAAGLWAQQDATPDWVLLTSPAAWQHWQQVAGDQALSPGLLGVSPRMTATLRAAGATQVLESAGAGTEAIVDCLLRWRRSGPHVID